ncbi:fatty acid desaturase family protein [Hazenella coriacea]|uniref:Fatty acid desaturase n=1 Tax=Hazenella coriacea TaxID=1179467 RepID=A0A4R3L793_9BACL|nr:fatty acid desaturase [Hazenella coriacea]TCS95801.1 fatty acid desaturase [Hazenella coriacea]
MTEKKFELHPMAYYQSILRRTLPREIFRRQPHRIVWLFVHVFVILASVIAILFLQTPMWLKLILAVLIGNSLGTLGFLGHEILHGSVVKGRRWMLLFGGICLLHWGLPPQVWINWHNRTHHHHTNQWFQDPDCFGPIHLYKKSRWVRFMEKLTPGSGTKRSYLFLFYWFTLHTAYNIFKHPKAFHKQRNRKYGRAYFIGVHLLWLLASIFLSNSFYDPLFLFVIPILISNFIMMSYVATNHFISPTSQSVSDPLVTTLTVRSPKMIEYFHLYNNYHVEHHLFPELNPSQARLIAKELRTRWPERYQEMSHVQAIKKVYQTPRLYEDEHTLKNPRTGEKAETLLSHYFNL